MDFGLTIVPYIEEVLVMLNVVRISFVIASFWRTGIFKYYLLLEMIYLSIRETALVDYGEVTE